MGAIVHFFFFTGFRHIMFDDNFDKSGYPNNPVDNLSLRLSCARYFGVYSREEVIYRDNFRKVKRPLEASDEINIKFVLEEIVGVYFEHLYLFKRDNEKREILFPKLTYKKLMQKFKVKRPLDEKVAREFVNIVFVELKAKAKDKKGLVGL